MNIQNIQNTDFKGTFILTPANSQTREAIPNIIKKGRQIFYDIKTPNDVVIVTKDKFDKKVSNFIETNNIPFEYYPQISTQSGLDDQKPQGLIRLLDLQNNCVVKNIKLLNKFLSKNPVHLSKQSEYLQETLNTLRLNIENPKIEVNDKGIFTIRDDVKKRTIKSTGFKSGNSYVYIYPDAAWEDIKRYFVISNGKQISKEYKTPDEIMEFNKAFKKALEN